MGKHRYNYLDAAKCITGTMKCSCCGKAITEGQYRERETDERFVLHHRKCSADDPNWSRLDREAETRDHEFAEFQRACAEFKAKWAGWNLSQLMEDA